MKVERQEPETSVVDIFDRVLDKGIVIDAWLRLSVVGIQLISVEMRVVVASIETYLKNSEFICTTPLASPLEPHHLTH
jgi:gas vesicle structural protein